MANIIDILIRAQDQASDQIKKVEAAGEQLGQSMTPVTNALKVAGVATIALGAASVKMAGDYEQGLAIFQSVSGATAEQMALVSEKARQLGKDAALPGISAADAAGAMTELAKAGLDVNQTLAASKGVLSLAKAGQMEVADAALIASQALNAFKLEGGDAARVADILANGANASAADMRGLSLGLQQSAAVAGQFGVSLEDTVTTLGLFANRGLQGSDAGTSLKTMLIALSNPSKQAAEAMQEIGLQAYDASGKFVGMQEFAGRLSKSMQGLTQEQQNAALATIFGTDAFRAAAFLADSAGASYDSMRGAIGKVGAAQDLAAAQNAGFKGALDNLMSTLETVGTDIGMKVLPPLTELLRTLAASGVFDAFVNNLDAVVAVFGTLSAMFVAFKIIAFVQGVMAAVTALKAATGAATLFNAVLALNPIMLIVMAVIALIGILTYLQVKFNIFGVLFNWLRDTGIAVFSALGSFIGSVFNGILDIGRSVFNALWGAIKPVVDFIVGYFRMVLAVYTYIFQWMLALGSLVWNALWASVIKPVLDWVAGGMRALGSIVSGVWNSIAGAASAAWGWVRGHANNALNSIKGVWGGLSGWFGGIWNGITNALRGPANAVSGIFSGIASTIKSTIVGAINWVIDKVNGAIRAVNSVADKVPGAPKLGTLSRLAKGANNYGGGVTLVGERGPEIVDLPKGSNVYSATQSANALRNANGGGGVTIEKLEVNNNVDVGMVIRQIGWELRTQ